MRKIVSAVMLAVLLSISVMPAIALAQDRVPAGCTIPADVDRPGILDDLDCEAGGCADLDNLSAGNEECGMCCLLLVIKRVTDWIFYLLMVFVVVMIVIGGATYMMSAGSPEKAGKGKSIIIYGIIGLVIALVAQLIPSVVKMIVGM